MVVFVVVVIVGFLAKSGFTVKIFFPVAITSTQLNVFPRGIFDATQHEAKFISQMFKIFV